MTKVRLRRKETGVYCRTQSTDAHKKGFIWIFYPLKSAIYLQLQVDNDRGNNASHTPYFGMSEKSFTVRVQMLISLNDSGLGYSSCSEKTFAAEYNIWIESKDPFLTLQTWKMTKNLGELN